VIKDFEAGGKEAGEASEAKSKADRIYGHTKLCIDRR
jgi:hypothetical protein